MLCHCPPRCRCDPGKLKLDSSFAITTSGYTDVRLQAAVLRLQQRLEGRTGIVLPLGVAPIGTAAVVTITVKQGGAAYPQLGEDESYVLTIAGDRAILSANKVWGAMHGMETLLQLVAGDSDGYYFPLVNIQDKPRFPWRGLMIDVGRHFQPVDVIKRNIDGLAAVKMNVFHWHLSDDQGFRIESKRLSQAAGNGL